MVFRGSERLTYLTSRSVKMGELGFGANSLDFNSVILNSMLSTIYLFDFWEVPVNPRLMRKCIS